MSSAVPGSFQVDPTERIRLMLSATIVTVGGRDWTGRDLVTAGALSGRWHTLEADLARGLASLEDWTPPREPVKAALRDFRYARRLISADEFSDWLRQRGLTQAELLGAIKRRLAHQHDSGTRVADRPDPLPRGWINSAGRASRAGAPARTRARADGIRGHRRDRRRPPNARRALASGERCVRRASRSRVLGKGDLEAAAASRTRLVALRAHRLRLPGGRLWVEVHGHDGAFTSKKRRRPFRDGWAAPCRAR